MAEFPGGQQALADFLKKNLRFPEKAKAAGISGTVYVQFTVNADGSLSDIKVLRGMGYGCDEEAIRLIKLMPGWVPAKQRGKAVKSTMNLPVTFAVSV
jgi:protein TonB